MWRLNPAELGQLKGAGGERFAHFIDRLIRAVAARGGIGQSEVQTQLRVNIKDGGVDTQVQQPIPNDQSGWFAVPTCWQYKTEDPASIDDKVKEKKRNDLQREIHKPYVEQLIQAGYGYRFCVLGDLTPQKVADWEMQLKAEVQQINPQAPEPRVVHGGQLLDWGERFLAVIAWLRNMQDHGFHWEAWRDSCRAVTRHYVPNPEWEEVRQQIRQHVDFISACVAGIPCLTIGGAAGVGKTRLVFETLDELPASPGLVVYAADEQEAKAIATTVAITSTQTVILVADECTPETRHFLNENLRACVDRIRIVCLDNTGERLASRPSRLWLRADELKNTDEILRQNFPQVPGDRRQQYADLSRGFVRLAADMCLHDADLATGDLSGLMASVEIYVRRRVLSEHLPLISLLALFHKVGFREEVQSDLDALCILTNLKPHDFHAAVRVIRESPGFVVQAGRYWYASPEVVARVLFAEGWQCWVSPDPESFLKQLPDHLQQQLIDRVGKLGGKEARDQIASFFRQWFHRLTAKDLEAPQVASLAEAIVEAAPEEFLPQLRHVIEHGSAAELLQIRGHAPKAKWGPRRTLVWLLERLVSFPEFFGDCEACLFRLAVHEMEPQIGNNATAIWQNLFSVYDSGTAAPFHERIKVLRSRIASSELEAVRLGFSGLDKVFEEAEGNFVGPPVVAGRLRLRDWQPSTANEERDCYRAALSLCEEQLTGNSRDHRRLAFDVLVSHMSFLLYYRLLDELSAVLIPQQLAEDEARKLLNAVDHFLEREDENKRATDERARQYLRNVRDWIDTFRPSNFDGRLRSICTRKPWDRRFADDPRTQNDELDELALEILSEPTRLRPHLEWLASREASSAERLGFAIGRRDEQFTCGNMIFEHAIVRGAAALLRGYVRGLAFSQRQPTAEVLELTTRLEVSHPEIAVDVLSYGGDSFDGLNRVLRLVESDAVSPKFLATFANGIGRRELTAHEAGRLLPFFVNAADSGDADSAKAGVRFISTFLHLEKRHSQPTCLDEECMRAHVWELVEHVLPHVEGDLAHEWSEIVGTLATYEPGRATKLLGRGLLSERFDVDTHAKKKLVERAAEHPRAVMEAFGDALLDAENGWRLQMGVFRDLLSRIPAPCVMEWVQSHGIDAARAIARHLPCPYVDDGGNALVPQLLDMLLREFDDDEVFGNFLTGNHSRELRGNETERLRREADNAKQFLNHPNHRIREWAKHEIADRLHMAEWGERVHAELFLPS